MQIDERSCVQDSEPIQHSLARSVPADSRIALLTGCQDRHYAFGLSTALASRGVRVDIIGNLAVNSPEFREHAKIRFLTYCGSLTAERSVGKKLVGWGLYYVRLLRYAINRQPALLHILWNNKFELLDRTLLMLYYKLLGKTVLLTAHNVNQGRRDSQDSLLNRLTLRCQYGLCDHVFVHTRHMKNELCADFGVRAESVTVIPYGINNAVPHTEMKSSDAKARLGVAHDERTILFFGGIKPYKGLEHLIEAFEHLCGEGAGYRLIIAGERKKEAEAYFDSIQRRIAAMSCGNRIIQVIRHIPDEETEVYFKGADVAALPYKDIFQSGILFLAYSFGLPAVATDVGAFREEIIAGMNGFLCRPGDPLSLAQTLRTYFESDLFRELPSRRPAVQALTNNQHSWDVVAEITQDVYRSLIDKRTTRIQAVDTARM